MDGVAVRDVKRLPSAEKRSLENIVGRPLGDDQQVFVLAFTPGAVPSAPAREEAMTGIAQTWKKVEENLGKHPTTEEEFDAAIDEAVKHVRREKD